MKDLATLLEQIEEKKVYKTKKGYKNIKVNERKYIPKPKEVIKNARKVLQYLTTKNITKQALELCCKVLENAYATLKFNVNINIFEVVLSKIFPFFSLRAKQKRLLDRWKRTASHEIEVAIIENMTQYNAKKLKDDINKIFEKQIKQNCINNIPKSKQPILTALSKSKKTILSQTETDIKSTQELDIKGQSQKKENIKDFRSKSKIESPVQARSSIKKSTNIQK